MSIRNKLITYTFFSIFITLVIVAFTIDHIITNIYNDNAITELKRSYTNFKHEQKTIENDILNQTLQIANDHNVVAISNMVNRYQNKLNYQPLIFNNDKKKIATYLLKQISLTKPEQAIIYDKNGDLIAYAIHTRNRSEAGFISYENGSPLNNTLSNHEAIWKNNKLPESIDLQIKSLNKEISFLTYSGKISYTSQKNKFIIGNSQIISRNLPDGTISLLGIIKINKSLDDEFFNEASSNGSADISLLLHNGYLINQRGNIPTLKDIYKNSSLHGSSSSLTDNIITNNYSYIHSYIWPTKAGNNYILISSSRLDLISALNKTRTALFISFIITAILAIIFGIIWLNKLISTPLKLLSEQATISNPTKLPNFPVRKGNDEISLLGKVLNDMVDAIKNREFLLLENEAQLSHTQKLAKIGGWKINHQTGELNYSNEIFSILGLDPNITPASLEIIANAIHPDDLTIVQEAHSKSMKEQIPYDLIHRLVMKDKKVKTVHVYSQTVFDDKSLPITTIGTMQDITEQTTKDEQLRRSQKMDAIGKLTGGIAHDFNNMLGVILGFSELLQNTQNQTENSKKYLNEIINASNRASKLTSKLLSFSRKDNTDATNIELNTILYEEQIMLEKILTVRINLILELAEDLWEINLDKNELEDALINMSINAMHAMPSGGKLTLSTHNSTLSKIDASILDIPAGDYVLLSVTDTGTGMSQDTKQRIFEPFFTTKDDKGTGLGMSQVYGFVQRSHGAIHIYSDIGHGTRITLYFPRHISNKTETVKVKENENNIDLTGTSTILVVDDEMALRDLTSEILSSNGYKVLTAESGIQALKTLETEDVNLVFSDVIMPGMDGYQLSNKIRELYPNIKIQMASGFSDINDPTILESELHKNRLQKPYNSQTLLKKIKLLLK